MSRTWTSLGQGHYTAHHSHILNKLDSNTLSPNWVLRKDHTSPPKSFPYFAFFPCYGEVSVTSHKVTAAVTTRYTMHPTGQAVLYRLSWVLSHTAPHLHLRGLQSHFGAEESENQETHTCAQTHSQGREGAGRTRTCWGLRICPFSSHRLSSQTCYTDGEEALERDILGTCQCGWASSTH